MVAARRRWSDARKIADRGCTERCGGVARPLLSLLRMRLLVSLVLACALATPAVADGVYVTESFGGGDVKDELGERIDSVGRLRVSVGYRRKAWALELWGGLVFGNGHGGDHDHPEPAPCGGCVARSVDGGGGGGGYHHGGGSILGAYGLDLKYLQPLGRRVDGYLRAGASGIGGSVAGDAYAGRGLGVGAGVQLKGKVRALGFLWWPLFFTGVGPKVTAALWADAGYDFYRLHRQDQRGPSLDAQVTTLSFGLAVGSDF